MNTLKKLAWLSRAGIDECIAETPINRFLPPKTAEKAVSVGISSTVPVTDQDDTLLQQACASADSAATLNDLYRTLDGFESCPLKKTAAHTLTGRGIENKPLVLCIGDVPDTTDEKQALIFSGETGALLDRMLKAIGLSLNKNAYVTNLIPWRPPGKRTPTSAETALCLPFLKKQIALIKPAALLLFGNLPVQTLTGAVSVSKARQQHLSYQNESVSIPLFTTFHPAFVLKMPTHRKFVWEDLQKLQKYLQNNNLL